MREFLISSTQIPPCSDDVILSPDRRKLLLQGIEAGLTLVIAPFGYGKTCLLSSFCDDVVRSGRSVVWLNLEGCSDGTPETFFFNVCSALAEKDEAAFGSFLSEFQFENWSEEEERLFETRLANKFAGMRKRYYLVFDSFEQLIGTPAEKSFIDMGRCMPRNCSMAVLSSRHLLVDLMELKIEGRVVEIECDGLRLGRDEIAYYFSDQAGVDLTEEEIDEYYESSLGAPAFVKALAQEARKRGGQPRDVIEAVGADLRGILVEKRVLPLGEEVARSIASVSMLDRFTLSLVERLSGSRCLRSDFARFKKEDFFIEEEDLPGRWYRIPQILNAAFVEYRKRIFSAEEYERLCDLAYDWFESQKCPEQAIDLAIKRRDSNRLTLILSRNIEIVLQRGYGSDITNRLNRMSPGTIGSSKVFIVVNAWTSFLAGKPVEAFAWLKFIKDDDQFDYAEGEHPDGDNADLNLIIGAIRACCTIQAGGVDRGIDLSLKILHVIEAVSVEGHAWTWLQVTLWHVLGEAYERKGMLKEAFDYLNKARMYSIMAGRTSLYFLSTHEIARLELIRGDFIGSKRTLDEALRLVDSGVAVSNPDLGYVYLALGYYALHSGSCSEACEYVDKAHALMRESFNIDAYLDYLVIRSRIELANGHLEEAQYSINTACEASMYNVVPRGISTYAYVCKVFVQFSIGDIAGAQETCNELERMIDPSDCLYYSRYLVHKARLMYAKARYEEALAFLEEAREITQNNGLRFLEVHVDLNTADVLWRLKRESEAIDVLLRCLSLASRIEAHMMLRVHEGALEEMLETIAHGNDLYCLQQRQANPLLQKQVEKLIDDRRAYIAQTHPIISLNGASLTAKEMRVLQLLREGLTKKQIAEQLSISPNTVKTHVRNIYSKLGVHDRDAL